MKSLLSPRELAEAIGVSESSVKRWTDEGMIRAARTAGGHRRIPVGEAIRFVRESRAALVKPELLGLPDLATVEGRAPVFGEEESQLLDFLRRGAAAEARGLILYLYLNGRSIAEIVDGPVKAAMSRLGELWREEEAGIFVEHRATDICIQALNQLRALAAPQPSSPRAVGGAVSHDPYLLPTLAAATVLGFEGWYAVNLGADTPVETLLRAHQILQPRLLWLSVSVTQRADELRRQIEELLTTLDDHGPSLVLGGRQRHRLELVPHPRLYIASSMAELAAFIRGLTHEAPAS